MKLRYVLVALSLVATAACQSSPTAPDTSRAAPAGSARFDGTPTPTPTPDPVPAEETVSRGSGWAGSGT